MISTDRPASQTIIADNTEYSHNTKHSIITIRKQNPEHLAALSARKVARPIIPALTIPAKSLAILL